MKLTVLTCTGCGSSLDFVVGLPSAECPYCGQTMHVGSGTAGSIDAPTFNAIIPMAHDRESFFEKTLEFLADGDDTPDDLLIAFEVDEDLRAVFAPYHRHKISFDGSMTCDAGREVVHYVSVKRGDRWVQERKTDIEWEPFTTSVKGRVTIDVCLAEGIDEALLHGLQTVTVDQKLQRFEPSLVSNHAIQHAIEQVEADEVFMARGYESLADHVQSRGQAAAPSINRNVSTRFAYTVEDQTMFLAGIWLQTYQYKGQKYKIVMDGGSSRVFGYRPEDPERMSWLEDLRKLGHYAWAPGAGCVLLSWLAGSGLVFLVGALTVGGGYLASHLLRKQVVETSSSFRQNLLAAIKADGRGGDVSQHTKAAEARYENVRRTQALVPGLYVGAIGLSLLLIGVGALMSWWAQRQPEALAAETVLTKQAAPVTPVLPQQEEMLDAAGAAADAAATFAAVTDEGSLLDPSVAEAVRQAIELQAGEGTTLRMRVVPSLTGYDISAAFDEEVAGGIALDALVAFAPNEGLFNIAYRTPLANQIGEAGMQQVTQAFASQAGQDLAAATAAIGTKLRELAPNELTAF